MRMLNNRICVRVQERERKIGSIVIPEAAQEQPRQGEIVAVGPGRKLPDGKRQPCAVVAGDKVLFGPHAGATATIGGEDFLVMYENEILAVIE